MKPLIPSTVSRRRGVFLSAIPLAAATSGALYFAVAQTQEVASNVGR